MRNFEGNQNVSGAVDVSNLTLDILTLGLTKTLAPQACGMLAKGFNSSNQSINQSINKHLMTGHKGNSEFCFPETLNVPLGEAERPVIKCFVIPSRKSSKKNYLLETIAYIGCARKTERLPKPTCSI